ncbi:hypothetical protein BG004_003335 [Podila humilis]|nr:hypothetical protein BG004_003335 [Podila humilis]
MSTYSVNVPVATISQSTTCLTCAIRLPSLETQQKHHKSDWHTYNLKRKVVYLPPVSAETFAQLVTASKEQANPVEVAQPECVPCNKKYLSFQAYDNHVNSKKHKLIAAAYGKNQAAKAARSLKEESTTLATTTITLSSSSSLPSGEATQATTATSTEKQLEPSETVCLFCSHTAKDAQTNYAHMRSSHGFFLPSMERLIDLPGMLTYLAERLLRDLDCLWCTPSIFSKHLRADQELGAGFANLQSVRRHMLDKGHCKLAMDQGAEREYADFYLPLDLSDSNSSEDEAESTTAGMEAPEDSSMDMDEDEKKLHQVLLDEEGNWILDNENTKDDLPSGIKVDPITNELVLNNRRLAHKDAVRRQKVESRTVTLAPRRSSSQRPTSDDADAAATTTPANDDAESDDGKDAYSTDLLKSQTVGASALTVRSDQLSTVAILNASAQDYESTKRAKAATKLSSNANDSGRRRYHGEFGLKK